MIEVHELGKRFQPPGAWWMRKSSDKAIEALCDVSLTVGSGEVYGLLGANGAGKTTLLRVLTTSLAPTVGTAKVAGWDVQECPSEVRRRVGFVSQETEVYRRLTPRETLHFFGDLSGWKKERSGVGWRSWPKNYSLRHFSTG